MAFISVGLTFTSECSHCRNPLPVNQASELTLCSECWQEVHIPVNLWRMSVAENGEMHLCDRGFDNFRILAPDGSLVWRSPATESEDESRAEELVEAMEA